MLIKKLIVASVALAIGFPVVSLVATSQAEAKTATQVKNERRGAAAKARSNAKSKARRAKSAAKRSSAKRSSSRSRRGRR